MSIVVNLMTTKEGEIKNFLDYYYDEDTQTDDDVMEWIYVYNNSKDAIDTVLTFMNNAGNYDISLWVQVGDDELVHVKKNNQKEVINRIEQSFTKQYV